MTALQQHHHSGRHSDPFDSAIDRARRLRQISQKSETRVCQRTLAVPVIQPITTPFRPGKVWARLAGITDGICAGEAISDHSLSESALDHAGDGGAIAALDGLPLPIFTALRCGVMEGMIAYKRQADWEVAVLNVAVSVGSVATLSVVGGTLGGILFPGLGHLLGGAIGGWLGSCLGQGFADRKVNAIRDGYLAAKIHWATQEQSIRAQGNEALRTRVSQLQTDYQLASKQRIRARRHRRPALVPLMVLIAELTQPFRAWGGVTKLRRACAKRLDACNEAMLREVLTLHRESLHEFVRHTEDIGGEQRRWLLARSQVVKEMFADLNRRFEQLTDALRKRGRLPARPSIA